MSLLPSSRVAWAVIAPLVCLLLFTISAAAQDSSAKSTVHNLHEIQEALAACMQPLAAADPYQAIRITARLGFSPRTTFRFATIYLCYAECNRPN
jgi:hypothetical protein